MDCDFPSIGCYSWQSKGSIGGAHRASATGRAAAEHYYCFLLFALLFSIKYCSTAPELQHMAEEVDHRVPS